VLTIGQLSARFGLATHVLRHWESVGLLPPAERVNGRRLYQPTQASRIALILRAKEAGLSLEQLRTLLTVPSREDRRELLRDRLAQLERRMAELEIAREMLVHAMDCESEDFTACLKFRSISERTEGDCGCGTEVVREGPSPRGSRGGSGLRLE
jgi:MerR family transcriptional regulator, copper efflux regulator